MMSTKEVYKSRWGYHPCSYPDYLTLKYLHKKYWEAVYRSAANWRWWRKDEQNRVGEEPPICGVYTQTDRASGYIVERAVLEDYWRACTPCESPDQVEELELSLGFRNELYAKLKKQEEEEDEARLAKEVRELNPSRVRVPKVASPRNKSAA
jgi:hypothetical protein